MNYHDYRFERTVCAVRASANFSLEGKKWLDLGCHNGSFARILFSYGLHATGIDVWDPKLKTEQSWNYVQFDLNAGLFPVDKCNFDVVSALEVIEHIIDTDRFLCEVHRVLKPEGLFVLSTPNICMLKNRFRILLGLYPYGLEYRNIIHHVRLYSLKTLLSHLREHDFEILSAEGEKLIPQRVLETDRFIKLSELLARTFPSLCSNLRVVVRCIKS